jgi:hypothetical protein
MRVSPTPPAGLQTLVQSIAERVGRHLERRGAPVRDAENSYLALGGGRRDGEDTLRELQGILPVSSWVRSAMHHPKSGVVTAGKSHD